MSISLSVQWLNAYKSVCMYVCMPIVQDMRLDVDHLRSLLTSRTKIVAVSHASNVLGITNPVRDIVRAAHAVGMYVCMYVCMYVWF